jgi:dihydrofolate reductase
MGRLIYSMGVSLDGFIAGPGGEIAVPAPDEEVHRFHNDEARELAAHLCGRRLYEVMSFWDAYDEDDASAPEHEREFAAVWKTLPKVVFSATLETVGPNARLAEGTVEEEVARLATSGDVAVGGAGLAAACVDVIDEFRPVVHPVVAGGGTPFFPPGVRLDLRLLETRTFSSGVVALRYGRS